MIDIATYDTLQSELDVARAEREALRKVLDASQVDYSTANERVLALESAVSMLGSGVAEVKATLAKRVSVLASPADEIVQP